MILRWRLSMFLEYRQLTTYQAASEENTGIEQG
jgi:membrane protein CcdC involved in cytochrome C biogenesis